jgi:hypothetical protein
VSPREFIFLHPRPGADFVLPQRNGRFLELAAATADSAGDENGETGDLFEQAAASFHAAGELKLEKKVRTQAESHRWSTTEWTVEQLVQHTTHLVQHQLLHEAAFFCESWAEEKAASADGVDIQLAEALSSRLQSRCESFPHLQGTPSPTPAVSMIE